jgi:hypothetical protein
MYLFQILVGCTPIGRHTEQHDVYFGIAAEPKDLIQDIKTWWPEAADNMHLDAIRKVQKVGDFSVHIVDAQSAAQGYATQLFFLNLGGYKADEFDEFHYKMIVAAQDSGEAIRAAKQTAFYKHTGFAGAASHVDDKYGVDVDDVYKINDILPQQYKDKYRIVLTPANSDVLEDKFQLGYFTVKKIMAGLYESE